MEECSQDIKRSQLTNGIEIVTEYIPSAKTIYIGFLVDVGSRDEDDDLQGCSHFIEHLLPKGTKNRTAHEIDPLIELKGGDLNADTDRDITRYYAWILKEDMESTIEILSDMVQNPLFDNKDIKTERSVILSEISDLEDDPSELIMERFVKVVWKGSRSSHPTGGTKQTVKKITRDQINEFFQRHYIPSNILVTAVGNLDHQNLVEKVDSQFHDGGFKQPRLERDHPRYVPKDKFFPKNWNQTYLCIVAEGVPYGAKDRATLEMITTYLGEGFGSKLVQEIREKKGLVYDIEVANQNIKDAGLFSIFASTKRKHFKEVVKICHNELENIKSGIEPQLLEETKRKSVSYLIRNNEDIKNKFDQLGYALHLLGRPEYISEQIQNIHSVTSEQTAELATKIFDENRLSLIAFYPKSFRGKLGYP